MQEKAVFIISIKENLEINFIRNVAKSKLKKHVNATKGNKRIQHIEGHTMIMNCEDVMTALKSQYSLS